MIRKEKGIIKQRILETEGGGEKQSLVGGEVDENWRTGLCNFTVIGDIGCRSRKIL